MTALTAEIAVKQMGEKLRDVEQTVLSLSETVAKHDKDAIEDRKLVVKLGELVNKLMLKVDTPRTSHARQARK